MIPFTLFSSSIILAAVFLIFIVGLFIADIKGSGTYATLSFAILVGLNYFWGTIPLKEIFTIYNIALYIFIGFIFALIRTYFKGRELDKEHDSYKKNFDLRDNVLRWWGIWPISLLTWVFGKLLINVFEFLYDLTEKAFDLIFNLHTVEPKVPGSKKDYRKD